MHQGELGEGPVLGGPPDLEADRVVGPEVAGEGEDDALLEDQVVEQEGGARHVHP